MIPDFIPNLTSGAGDTPADGGCLIQVASWLNDGHSWTDQTPCVHFLLRDAAIDLNDDLPDEVRQQIMKFAPRLIGTGMDSEDDENAVAEHLVHWAASRARAAVGARCNELLRDRIDGIDWYRSKRFEVEENEDYGTVVRFRNFVELSVGYAAMAVGRAACDCSPSETRCSMEVKCAANQARIGFMSDMIDEYDSFTGRRITGATVSDEQWKHLASVMNGVNA